MADARRKHVSQDLAGCFILGYSGHALHHIHFVEIGLNTVLLELLQLLSLDLFPFFGPLLFELSLFGTPLLALGFLRLPATFDSGHLNHLKILRVFLSDHLDV